MKVLVALPSYKGFVAKDHARSVQNLFLTPQPNGERIEWLQSDSVGCPVLPRVRNALCAQALAQNCDAILFIDDDIGFEPLDVFRMISHGVGVVGAIPQKRMHRWDDQPRLAVSPVGLRINPESGLALPVEPRLPMALTLIATQVLRDIIAADLAPPFIYASAPLEAQAHMRMFFGYELVPVPSDSREMEIAQELGIENPMSEDGEDHFFCRRAEAAGYDCLIDTEVELRHWEGQVCHDYSIKKMIAAGHAEVRSTEANAA